MAAEWLEGLPLTAASGAARALPDLRDTGRALAGFHALDVPPDRLELQPDEGPGLLALARDLAALLPDEERRILALGDRLAAAVSTLSDSPRTTVHGDFHPGQVLICRGGPALVDLDRAGRGPAVGDIGEFLAHLAESEW